MWGYILSELDLNSCPSIAGRLLSSKAHWRCSKDTDQMSFPEWTLSKWFKLSTNISCVDSISRHNSWYPAMTLIFYDYIYKVRLSLWPWDSPTANYRHAVVSTKTKFTPLGGAARSTYAAEAILRCTSLTICKTLVNTISFLCIQYLLLFLEMCIVQ